MSDAAPRRPALSRRRLLQGAGAAGVAAGALTPPARQARAEAYRLLTPAQARFLAAACDTLIPADEWPSASEAGVVTHIDRALAGPYGRGDDIYLQGPFFPGEAGQGWQTRLTPAEVILRGAEAVDRLTGGFADLSPESRAETLAALEAGERDLGEPDAELFFTELWSLTNEGYFADPIHGGNLDYAGWRMVGFPGAHAYYLDGVDDWNTPYFRGPSGVAHRPGLGTPRLARPPLAGEG